jgi:hypothetical protein
MLFVADKVEGKLPTYSRWAVYSDATVALLPNATQISESVNEPSSCIIITTVQCFLLLARA